MACKAIHQHLVDFPLYGAQLERLILCHSPDKSCWLRSCKKCLNAETKLTEILKKSRKNSETPVIWHQWKKDKTTNRYQKCTEHGTLKSLIKYFLDILPDFLKHSFIKRNQAAEFEKDGEEVVQRDDLAILQIDFAESFSCEAQDEIQSAHWNQGTVR